MVCYCIMPKKRLTEMSVDQPQKSQSIDWDTCMIYFVNIIKTRLCTKWPLGTKRSDIDPLKTYGKTASAIQELDRVSTNAIECGVIGRRQRNSSNTR